LLKRDRHYPAKLLKYAGYLNLLKKPPLLENAVRMAVLHPLLFIAGFYLSPFQVKPEKSGVFL
jgi:hypothetical protein